MIVGQAPPSTLGYRVGAPNRFTPEAQQYAVGPRLRKGLPLRTRIWHGKAEHSGMYEDVRTGAIMVGGSMRSEAPPCCSEWRGDPDRGRGRRSGGARKGEVFRGAAIRAASVGFS